ncbi:MAG: LytTR family transcriptional regulator DNA-binding domain-containing protein [Prevotella sp.]|nr:LytTR family transcriptional regulator DNA-binding domain-containing protein [Prevotella sp.]MBO7537868.1 LytTR family transcriptional regulator DNA-binding domain-containing protein [Prevotella sp.]
MNKAHKETLSVRLISTAFMVLAIAIFKPFGLEMWQWQAYVHLLAILALGLFSCFLTEIILRYVIRMPRSYNRGVSYIISRNLRFQCINTPLVSLFICLYRHFAMSDLVEGNRLSLSNYLETLVIIAFLSFAIGLYWRFKFRSRYLAAELEETRQLNEQLKKLQTSGQDSQPTQDGSINQDSHITLEGSTNEHVCLEISDLLYIEAVGNYVKVCQLQDNEVHTTMLRATMKQMEDALQTYPIIIRCHRAFMVNLGQVEQISSNSRAMQLVMRHSHDAIPVSRSNISKLKEQLG